MATVRETVAEDFGATWRSPRGLASAAVVNHKTVGLRFMGTALVFFLVGGVLALLMRTQLAVPENDLLGPQTYNRLFTMHGATMMFLFAVPFLEGLANYLLPLMLGTRDLPFPRFNAFNYWLYLLGGVIFYSSFLFNAVPDAGWFAYPPLAGPQFTPGAGQDFFLVGLTLAEISAIGAAIELIVLILVMRPPGMTLARMPLFAWAMLVTAFLIVTAFAPLVVGSALLEMDRAVGTDFYNAGAGGNPVLWQHLFWFFGHPEVYVMFLPATGIVSQVVQTFARRPIAGYPFVVVAIILTGFLSLGLWVHHMFTVGIPVISLNLFTAASMTIAIATGIQIVAWITTLWLGRPVLRVPLLFVVGFVVTFVLGGITGVMVAAVPFDRQVHDSFFLVAHFHYVLIGGVVLPAFAGLYYWLPKVTGWLLDEHLGRWNFWTIFVGFNLTFFPMHVMGLLGMPRRVYTYQEGLGLGFLNMLSTVGAYLLGVGVLLFLVNIAVSARRRLLAGHDPHGGDTLEWSIPSPPPDYNFAAIPVVASRHPMWEPPADRERARRPEPPPWALDERPLRWRGALATTALDAQPAALVHLTSPTLWPLGAAIGVGLLFVALIPKSVVAAGVGAAGAAIAFLGWTVRNERERGDVQEAPVAELHLEVGGTGAVSWWGAVLLLVVLVSSLASLLFSYFFLRVHAPAWPLDGIEAPAIGLGVALLVLLAAAAVAGGWSWRRARGPEPRPRWGLPIAGVIGVAAAVLLVVEMIRQPFAPGENAYSSLVFALLGFEAALVLAALIVTAMAVARASATPRARRLALLTTNTALMWTFTAASAVVLFVTLYLTPRVS